MHNSLIEKSFTEVKFGTSAGYRLKAGGQGLTAAKTLMRNILIRDWREKGMLMNSKIRQLQSRLIPQTEK